MTDTPRPTVTVDPERVDVLGVGPCIAAADFVSLVCAKTRHDAQTTINSLLKSKAAAEVLEILCRKADVPGFWEPTYVITYDECFDLSLFLPRQRVKGLRQNIASFFKENHSAEELQDTITGLGKRKAAEGSDGPGYVYAAYSVGNGMKIGMTCLNDPLGSIRALNGCVRNPFQAVDILWCGNPGEIKRLLHDIFASLRVGDHTQGLFDVPPETLIKTFNHVRQAATVLQAMPEAVLDAGKVREYLERQE